MRAKASGWSISDKGHVRSSDAGSWSEASNARKQKIAVIGAPIPAVTVAIAAEHESIGGGLEDLGFTLERAAG